MSLAGAGTGDVAVVIVDPQGRRDTVEVALEDKGDSTFRCTYRPVMEGPHTVHVAFAGAPITRSPFPVQVAEGKVLSPVPTITLAKARTQDRHHILGLRIYGKWSTKPVVGGEPAEVFTWAKEQPGSGALERPPPDHLPTPDARGGSGDHSEGYRTSAALEGLRGKCQGHKAGAHVVSTVKDPSLSLFAPLCTRPLPCLCPRQH